MAKDFWYGKYNTRHEQASFVWLAGQFDGYKLTRWQVANLFNTTENTIQRIWRKLCLRID